MYLAIRRGKLNYLIQSDVDLPCSGDLANRPQIRVFLNEFLRISADVETNCAGSCESSFPTGLCFSFFWGLEIVKFILNSDFGWVKI